MKKLGQENQDLKEKIALMDGLKEEKAKLEAELDTVKFLLDTLKMDKPAEPAEMELLLEETSTVPPPIEPENIPETHEWSQ